MKQAARSLTASALYDELIEIFDRYFPSKDIQEDDNQNKADDTLDDGSDRYSRFEADTENYLYNRIESKPYTIRTAIAAVERIANLNAAGYKRDAINLLIAIEKVIPDLHKTNPSLAATAMKELMESFERITGAILTKDPELALFVGLDISMRIYTDSALCDKGYAFFATALNQFAYRDGSAENILKAVEELVDDIVDNVGTEESDAPALHIIADFYQTYTDRIEEHYFEIALGLDVEFINMAPGTIFEQKALANGSRRFDKLIRENPEGALDLLCELKAGLDLPNDDCTDTYKSFIADKESILMFILENNPDLTQIKNTPEGFCRPVMSYLTMPRKTLRGATLQ